MTDKPTQKTKTYFDYNECRNYLQEKHGYNEQDYTGLFRHLGSGEPPPVLPYQNFWHWVVGRYNAHNDCFVTFSRDVLPEIEEGWVKTIYSHYLDEFADEKGELEMHVWW